MNDIERLNGKIDNLFKRAMMERDSEGFDPKALINIVEDFKKLQAEKTRILEKIERGEL
jgi:uncharacterized protein (UPF0335 family)